MSHRSLDDSVIVTRSIPLSYLLSTIGAILIWAVSQYVSYSKLVDKVDVMTIKMTEVSAQLTTTSAKNIEQDMIIADVKRRLDLLDAAVLSTRFNAVQNSKGK
jgi:hypothetical protein